MRNSRCIHVLSKAELTEYQRTNRLNCADHEHVTREKAENKLRWRLVERISDRIVCVRTLQEPDRQRLREMTGWAVRYRWTLPRLQLVTAEAAK